LEAVAIVDRAQPFPAPPPEIEDGKLKIEAELDFPSPGDIFKEDAALHAKLHGICRGC
jgi:protein TonB